VLPLITVNKVLCVAVLREFQVDGPAKARLQGNANLCLERQ